MIAKTFGLSIILLLVILALTTGFLLDYIYFYPLFMSFIWIFGGIYFYFHWEKNSPGPDVAPTLQDYPLISILIPCYNEARVVRETIDAASKQNYPNFEIVAINDGSRDDTGTILDALAKKIPHLRVVHLASNQGKAMALRAGAVVARGEYFVCVDGDAMLHPNAAAYMVKPMVENARVGAVTGNPRVRSRVTVLGKIQVGEFSSIIGLIKRAQRVYGNIYTVSGVIAAYRRRTLHDCGYWDPHMLTEDIDISWAMQIRHWQIQYEPCAVAWILMPETFVDLWKQRLRWAQGGAEVYFKNITRVWHWRNRRMWMLIADFCLSSTWALAYAISVGLWALGKFTVMPEALDVPIIWPPVFWGLLLATVSLIQFAIALLIESRYDHRLFYTLVWVIWYPLFFWALSLFTKLCGLPRAFLKTGNQRAQWTSPDRGFL